MKQLQYFVLDAASDYGVPRTPQLEHATDISQHYLKSGQGRHKTIKSPGTATEIQYTVLHLSPQSSNIASMSPCKHIFLVL